MIAGGLLLLALGAILRFAVTAEVAGVSISTVGLILLIVGAITLVIGLLLRFSGRDSTTSY
ncbi:MAG TPA: hypothetical protein VKG38_01735 [Solirubrobacteraceae bacterium]|nr:hypothetical protein [Solirubrobacteraceae bacterium]